MLITEAQLLPCAAAGAQPGRGSNCSLLSLLLQGSGNIFRSTREGCSYGSCSKAALTGAARDATSSSPSLDIYFRSCSVVGVCEASNNVISYPLLNLSSP